MNRSLRKFVLWFVAVASVSSIAASVVLRDAGNLSKEDLGIVTALDDVEAALRWRAEVEKAVPADLGVGRLEDRGYTSFMEDELTNWVHYINWGYVDDERSLDPAQPESYLFKVLPDDTLELRAVVFMLPARYTYANTPDIADGGGVWHTHPMTCLAGDPFAKPEDGRIDGSCAVGAKFPDRLMIHAWVKPNLCGPFAPAIVEPDPDLPPWVPQDFIREHLAGADKNGEIPGCEEDLARSVWPEAFR